MRGSSAPACPCGVGCAPHPPMSGIRLGRNTSRRRPAAPVRRCAHPAARARSGPVPRRASASALVAHVRFCGARSARLTVSKVSALPLNCAENCFALAYLWSAMRRCDTLQWDTAPSPVPWSRGAARGAATRGGGGDGGRRGRRQARCRRSGDGRYSDRAGRRQTAPHADAALRRNPPEPEMCRSEAEGRFGEAEPEGCASIHVRRTSGRTLAQR